MDFKEVAKKNNSCKKEVYRGILCDCSSSIHQCQKSSTRARIVANRAILLGMSDLYICGLLRKFKKTTRSLPPWIIRATGIVIHRGKGKK